MARVLVPCALLALLGCEPEGPREGTYVGNPGNKVTRIAAPVDLEVEEASTEAATITWIGCDGAREVVLDGEELDLLGGTDVEVPGLRLCGLEVVFDEPIQIAGPAQGEAAGPFTVWLQPRTPITLWGAAPLEIDGEPFVLELGTPEWLRLELGPEENVFEENSDVSGELAGVIVESSALFFDDDADGEVSPAERAVGPALSATLPPYEADEEGDTGDRPRVSSEGGFCATGGGHLGAGWLLLLLVAAYRRRR